MTVALPCFPVRATSVVCQLCGEREITAYCRWFAGESDGVIALHDPTTLEQEWYCARLPGEEALRQAILGKGRVVGRVISQP